MLDQLANQVPQGPLGFQDHLEQQGRSERPEHLEIQVQLEPLVHLDSLVPRDSVPVEVLEPQVFLE